MAIQRPQARQFLCPILAVGILLVGGCSGDASDTAAPRPALTVEAITPIERDLPRELPASGAIAAWQEVVIGVELSGLRVTTVEAEVGDRVERGQVLARLERGTLAAEVAQAEAALTEAVASAAEARANAERARTLAGSSALSAREVDQLVTGSATADARVERARAQLDNARRRLSYATIVAPDDGIVASRSVTPGEVVNAGTELYRMIRQGRIEWRAEIPERDYPQVRAGMTARVQPIGTGKAVEGPVRTVSPGLDPATRRGIAYVDLPLTPDLRPGMYVSGTLELGRTPAKVLPLSAVTTRDGSHYVFAVGEDRRVRELKVGIGSTLEEYVEITGGLPDGTQVVKSGGAFLRDGDLVDLASG